MQHFHVYSMKTYIVKEIKAQVIYNIIGWYLRVHLELQDVKADLACLADVLKED